MARDLTENEERRYVVKPAVKAGGNFQDRSLGEDSGTHSKFIVDLPRDPWSISWGRRKEGELKGPIRAMFRLPLPAWVKALRFKLLLAFARSWPHQNTPSVRWRVEDTVHSQ